MKTPRRHTGKRMTAWLIALCTLLSAIGLKPVRVTAGQETVSYAYSGYEVTYDVTAQWEEKRQVRITIHNTGAEPIRSWCLKYDEQGTVTELWNAVMTEQEGGMMVMKNAGHNTDIPAGGSISFGYTLAVTAAEYPEKFVLTQDRRIVACGYEVCHAITNDWGDGLQGTISITNLTDSPMEGWQLTFTTDLSIKDLWGAAFSREENRCTLDGHPWASTIPAGGTITIGYVGAREENSQAREPFSDFILTEIVAYAGEAGLLEGGSEESTENETETTTEDETETATETESETVTENETEKNTDGNLPEETTQANQADPALDSDDDGLPDILEADYGCDAHNPDSDGDGLPDGYEAFFTFTDPSKPDTDENKTPDSDEDPDRDGLTNLEEYHAGTDPWNRDSDYDGLTDYEELYRHGTNPLTSDTDGDRVKDSDELALSLDPNNPQTFGYPDNEYTTEQKVTGDSWRMAAVNQDKDNPYKLTVSMKAAGVAENNLSAQVSGYNGVINNEAIVGKSAELFYGTGLKIEEVTIEFHMDESAVENISGAFMNISDEFVGIKRLNIFKYYENLNLLLPVETFHDTDNNVVYAKTDELGTYCLMDMEVWLESIGYEPKETETASLMLTAESDICTVNSPDESIMIPAQITKEDASALMIPGTINAAANFNALRISKKDSSLDMVIVIQAVGPYPEAYEKEIKSLKIALERIFAMIPDTRVKFMFTRGEKSYTETDWMNNYNDVESVLTRCSKDERYCYEKNNFPEWCHGVLHTFNCALKENYREGASQVILLARSVNVLGRRPGGDYEYIFPNVADILTFQMYYDDYNPTNLFTYNFRQCNKNISSSYVTNTTTKNHVILGKTTADEIISAVTGETMSKKYMVTATGLRLLTHSFEHLDTLGRLDYDADGLTNIEEIDMQSGLIQRVGQDQYIYPTLKECMALGKGYSADGLKRFYIEPPLLEKGLKAYLDNLYILPLLSDPTRKDSDGDGILDNTLYYDSMDNKMKVYEWVRNSEDYFNVGEKEGEALRANPVFEWPVADANGNKYASLSTGFTELRRKMTRYHNAIDIVAPKGTPVSAAYAGQVIYTTPDWAFCMDCYGPYEECECGGGYGNQVMIQSVIDGKNFITRYAHLSGIDVTEGTYVEAGQIIGRVGSTGSSRGYHLDYSLCELEDEMIAAGKKDNEDWAIDPVLFDTLQNKKVIDDIAIEDRRYPFYMKIPADIKSICGGTVNENGQDIHCDACDEYMDKIKRTYILGDD